MYTALMFANLLPGVKVQSHETASRDLIRAPVSNQGIQIN